MKAIWAAAAAVSLLTVAPVYADAPVEVMIVASYHMNNPGHDLHNVTADDPLAPKRQAELAAVVDGLARFKPTVVAVESSPARASEGYGEYRAGTGKPNPGETAQIGFRLAAKMHLPTVYGIDEMADFPYEAVDAYATAHGQKPLLDALWKQANARVAAITASLQTGSVGATLRYLNTPEYFAQDQAGYRAMLQIGSGTDQPGVALLTAWYDRNFRICAHLVQAAKPGDRVVVVYGAGHGFLLRQCIAEMPGYKLVEANDYLVK